MRFLKCLKTSAVFVGTFIGAGFATGREIVLFFGNSNPLVPIVSAVVSGVFCSLFLYAGNKSIMIIPSKGGKLIKLLFSLAAFIIYSAMISACEEVLHSLTGINGLGIITVVIITIICLSVREGLKFINLLVVPLIVVLVIIMSTRAEIPNLPLRLNFHNAFAYSALNMFLGGYLIINDGKKMSNKEIIATGAVSAILLGLTLMMIYRIVIGMGPVSMPVMEAAIALNMRLVASLIILFAVITTMAGCFSAINSIFYTKNKWISGALISIKGIVIAVLGFKTIVDIGYPVVSLIGILYTVGVIVAIVRHSGKADTVAVSIS